jgi:hypothetical protein
MVTANVVEKDRHMARSIEPFSPSAWNFGSPDSPRDLGDYLDSFEHFDEPEPWLDEVSRVEWSNFFRVYSLDNEQLSKRARELLILYCLEVVERYAARIKTRPTLTQIQNLMTKDYREEYDNAVYQLRLALNDKVINQAVLTALANRRFRSESGKGRPDKESAA